MTRRKIHYAGAVQTSRMRIRSDGAHTRDLSAVTCRACLRVMRRDEDLAARLERLPVRCPSTFRGVQCSHGDGHSGAHEYVEAF